MDNNKILWDENKKMKFDFSNALDVFEPHELASLYSEYLSDVDFVLEEKEKLICLEYKNSNVENADAPEAFKQKIAGAEFWKRIAKKFYGSLLLIWACNKNQSDKPVQYILLMESNPSMDTSLKKTFIMKMMHQLPFKYNSRSEIQRKMIDEFVLLDLKEWKERYPQYPIYEAEVTEVQNHGRF